MIPHNLLRVAIFFFKLLLYCQSESICDNKFVGADGFTPQQDVEEVRQIERQLKRRFPIGAQVCM